MTEIASLGLSIRSDGVVVATDRLKDFEGAGRRADGVAGSLMRTAVTMGTALAGAFSVRALGGYADAWSDMQSRVGAAIKDMEAAPSLMQRITDIANASYSPLEQTAEIYSRNAGILRDLGRTATEAADFTEALNHALVTTATRGERAASVQNALAKAMAVGKLAGDGLETVLTHGSRVAEALAEELGTNVSGLRALASQGKITGDVIASALINRVVELREEAGQMDATLGDAGVIVNNVMTEWVGRIDKAWQASGQLATKVIDLALAFRGTADTVIQLGNVVGMALGPAFDMLSANMDTVAAAAGIAVAALAGFYAPALIGNLWSLSAALVTGVAGGIKAISLAMLANPIGVLIGGLALGVTAAFMFRDDIKQAIGVDVVEVFHSGANTVIGAMVGAVKASQAAWEVFPDFMAGLGARAWNSFLEGFEGSAISWTNPFSGEKFDLLNIDLSSFKKEVGGTGGAAVDAVMGAFHSTQGIDYVGNLASTLGDLWSSASGAGDQIGALSGQLGGGAGGQGLAGAASAANDNMKTLASDGLAKVGQFGQQVLSTLSSGFADVFKSVMTGSKSAGEAVLGLIGKLGDLFVNNAFQMLFSGGLGGGFGGGLGGGGGLLGGMIIPGILHSGGIAGSDGYGHGRAFPASTWNNAERYHSGGIAGLKSEEVPAILRKGEPVFQSWEHARQATGAANNIPPQKSIVEVRLAEGLKAEILNEAAGNSVKISQGMVEPVSKAVDHMANQQRYA